MKTANSLRMGSVFSPYAWVWVGVLLLYALALLLSPNAVSLGSLGAMLPFVGMLAIVSVGQTVVVMQRGIDFSVPGAVVLAGIAMADLSSKGWDLVPAILVTVSIGFGIGLLNGLIVVRLALTPLVATLASNGIYFGIALIISGGFPVAASQSLREFSRGEVLGLSTSFWLAVAFVAVLVFAINKTVAGRRFVAVGSSPLSANTSGIRVQGYSLLAYCVAGVCYAMAGVLIAGYIGSARMIMGDDYLMASIAAVVIGGTPLTGGR